MRGGRALKYDHRLNEKLGLAPPETAVMCVLMLRGPQTAGEIRSRTGRLHAFAGLEEVDAALDALMRSEPPRVEKLPRLPGTKENRFAHRLGGEAASRPDEAPRGEIVEPRAVSAPASAPPDDRERIERLEHEVQSLRRELEELRRELGAPKSPSE